MLLKNIFTFFFVIFLVNAYAQTNCYTNASMEGTPQSHVAPAPWNTCWGSPDTQPNQWGITVPASNGSTYVSFLAMDSYSYLEGMTQPLTTCMVAGQTYSFSVDLAHSNVYNTAEPGNCYSSFAVWGGTGPCDRSELLYCSGEIWNTSWQTYSITFTPTQNWCYIGFSPCYLTSCSGYINLLMDNISCIAPISSLVTTTNVTCHGLCDGTATANATSGTPPFTYLWNTNATTPAISNLCPGQYWVTVTDHLNQTASDTVTITEPAALTLSITVDNSPCVGASDGSVTAVVTGDAPPFAYNWQPSSQTTVTATGLSAGTHNLTVTDTSGCTITGNVVITSLPLPQANAGANQSICIGGQAILTATGGTSFLWSSGDITASITVTPQTTTTYTVTVSGNNVCSASDDVVVTVNNLPNAEAGNDVVICLGQTANLTASGGTSYVWSNSGLTASINVSPSTATTYTVTVTDINSCSATDSLIVTVNALPVAVAGADVQICSGNSSTLSGSGGISYLWSPATGLSSVNIADPVASPTITTTYILSVTDANGCINTDNTIVNVWPLPPANAGANQAICIGGSATIVATGGVSYIWDTGDITASITVTPTLTKTYTVTVTDVNGCTATDDIILTVNNLPIANAGADVPICYGTNTTLNASGGVNYQWSPATALSNSNIANPIANPTTPITYTVTVTDANGCTATDNMSISIYPAPVIAFTANKFNGCEPLLIQFTDNSTPAIQSWSWSFGDGNTSSSSNPLHMYQNAGIFTVTLTVTTTDGCVGSLPKSNMIEAYPNPEAEFSVSPSFISMEYPVAYFHDGSSFATIWAWNFGDINSDENYAVVPNPSHTYSLQGSYTVFLMVETAHGCTDSTSREVIIKPDFTFYIPNVFTPDADGINDFFQASGTNIAEYEMYIYNRWGELLFKTDDINYPWDGIRPDSGEAYMQDVYAYRIYARDMNGKRHYYYGHVTLLD